MHISPARPESCTHESQKEDKLDQERAEAPDRPKGKEEEPDLKARVMVSEVKPCDLGAVDPSAQSLTFWGLLENTFISQKVKV